VQDPSVKSAGTVDLGEHAFHELLTPALYNKLSTERRSFGTSSSDNAVSIKIDSDWWAHWANVSACARTR
jgi:hypothetical protein